jgi:hypothetical protein
MTAHGNEDLLRCRKGPEHVPKLNEDIVRFGQVERKVKRKVKRVKRQL